MLTSEAHFLVFSTWPNSIEYHAQEKHVIGHLWDRFVVKKKMNVIQYEFYHSPQKLHHVRLIQLILLPTASSSRAGKIKLHVAGITGIIYNLLSFSDANMNTVGSCRISVVNLSCSPDCLRIDESCRVSKRCIVQITMFTSGVLWPMASFSIYKITGWKEHERDRET